MSRVVQASRRYSLKELDELREAVKHQNRIKKYACLTEGFGVFRPDNLSEIVHEYYVDPDPILVEELVRTAMMAGVHPSEYDIEGVK